nr:peptidase C48, SUMO/sentrin/Ubl1 [Tanacetum cinerariifolium]
VPRQRNANDCGLFVLFYIERFLKEAPERLTEKDLSMFNKQWFRPEEASNLRWTINDLLVGEFKIAKDMETAALSPEI